MTKVFGTGRSNILVAFFDRVTRGSCRTGGVPGHVHLLHLGILSLQLSILLRFFSALLHLSGRPYPDVRCMYGYDTRLLSTPYGAYPLPAAHESKRVGESSVYLLPPFTLNHSTAGHIIGERNEAFDCLKGFHYCDGEHTTPFRGYSGKPVYSRWSTLK